MKIIDLEDKYKITPKLLVLGHGIYRKIEERDSMYKISTFLLESLNLKEKPFEGDIWITDALQVILLTWHNAFYRYGSLRSFHDNFKSFWKKYKGTVLQPDICKKKAKSLFENLLEILKREDGAKSGVAVAKALHLLNPDVFPLWDGYIANAYLREKTKLKFPLKDTFPPEKLRKFEEYWKFKLIVDKQCEFLRRYMCFKNKGKRFLYKRIDELNFVLFTKTSKNSRNSQNMEQIKQITKEHFQNLAEEAREELINVIEKGSFNIYLKVLDLILSS